MNLQFISWDDLNAIKENLDQYVSKFALPSNAWIEEELGHSPFLNTKYPMPDIHLDMSQPMDKAYLTDAANVQEFYGKLRFISDSQASDERLWAGLCLGPFYEYTQYRWKIALKCTKQDVKAHYFFGFGARRSLSRNALARLWWIGRLTYDDSRPDPYELTKFVCENADHALHIIERNTSNSPTMGSLFDGIGGFPLAAIHNGVIPLWVSEIEPFPIRVTQQRLPGMLHYGDITKLDGAMLPPVDIICGGSPCQDLSVAGARAGLAGERSGLFMEQIRIVKEMRDADRSRGRAGIHIRPRFMVWENVPGAFSSGERKGEDFRIVLEEIVRIKCGTVHVPGPYPWAWQPAGRILLGTEFSLCWRCLDAQYWGVPQRRKRIFLIADFAGRTADKVLFDAEGLFGDTAPGV